MKHLIYCLIALLFFCSGGAQMHGQKLISGETLGIKQGLSQGMITAIWQDHLGFMWFGTLDGLNKYDGYHFTIFRNDPFDSTSISGNDITTIFEDKKGRLWIGTGMNGLNLLDMETQKFIHFNTSSKPALSGNSILSVQQDKYGAIWVGTSAGLNRINIDESIYVSAKTAATPDRKKGSLVAFSIQKIDFGAFGFNEEFMANEKGESSFLISSKNEIWVSASQSLFKIKPEKQGSYFIVKIDTVTYFPKGKSTDARFIVKILEDTAADEICLKGSNFISVLNSSGKLISNWNLNSFDLRASTNQAIFLDNILWERATDGLFCFDVGSSSYKIVKGYNSEHNNMLKAPFSMYKDKAGIFWIGTGGFGIIKYNPATVVFNKVLTNSVTWMQATPTGNLLLYKPELNFYHRDTAKKQVQFFKDHHLTDELLKITEHATDLAIQDNSGSIWFNKKGAAKLNPGSRKLIQLFKTDTLLFPFFADNRNRLWFATSYSLNVIDKQNKVAASYPFPFLDEVESQYKFCQSIIQDINGIYWIATINGLYGFNETTGSWKHYRNLNNDKTSLSSNVIFSVCDDPVTPGKFIWVGTNGGGLARFDVMLGNFITFGGADGIPSRVVYGILTDNDKKIWISTNEGLACLTLADAAHFSKIKQAPLFKNIIYYREENGLQSNEFNRNAYSKGPDGTLFFGGVNGFNYFNPALIKKNNTIPDIVITDLKWKNKSLYANTDNTSNNEAMDFAVKKPPFLIRSIKLPFHDNMLTIEFAALDYTLPANNRFMYKLEGYGTEWIDNATSHSATFTNLDPGTYLFRVKGCTSGGLWNETGTTLQITILTPWYMSWWFRVSLLIIIVTSISFLVKYIIQQKLLFYRLRNDIASDLHDEIGSTLSSIYIYSEVAQSKKGEGLQTDNYLKLISNEVGEIINSLDDIVWTVNPKNDRFENIVNKMRASAVELFDAGNSKLHLDFDEHMKQLTLGMENRKNFYLFYKEAINNAAKYAKAGNVWISLALDKDMIKLTIEDDGVGFDVLKTSGNGLSNLKKRAGLLNGKAVTTSNPGKGTQVKLVFPYS